MKIFIILGLVILVLSKEHRPLAGGKYKPESNDSGVA